MSLNWEWNDKMGEIIDHDGNTYNIYQGNAHMIILWEDEKQYSLQWFTADKDHFKNQLGLVKGYDENFFCWYKKIKLDTKYKSVPEIVKLIAQCKKPFEIELY